MTYSAIKIRSAILAFMVIACTSVCLAQSSDSDCIVARTKITNYSWRYDFHYTTVDVDLKTPIVLSAAIFMSDKIHDKTVTAKGCCLLNHYTISCEADAPTSLTSSSSIEGLACQTPYFVIESDGIGFGLTKDRRQAYLLGRVTARNNIDAFLAGRKLLKAESYDFGSAIINLGYSQGGNAGMWVNRLVQEGYRSDELPAIDYSILGGGPYDIYAQYANMLETGKLNYPVALPLILYGIIAEGSGITVQDVFNDKLTEKLPEWFDTKNYNTSAINDSITAHFGDSAGNVYISSITKPEVSDTTSALMQKILPKLKENSLVYADWSPTKIGKMLLIHSKSDEVVYCLNTQNMKSFLDRQGYANVTVDYLGYGTHTTTGTYYAVKVMTELSNYTGGVTATTFDAQSEPQSIYRLDGTKVQFSGTLEEVTRNLAPGFYIIDHKKVIIR